MSAHLIFLRPDGAGGWVKDRGFTTADVPLTVEGVVCDAGYISSISPLRSQIDLSQAKGNIAQGVTFDFSLVDWTWNMAEDERKSAGIFTGESAFFGWRVRFFSSAGRTESYSYPFGDSLDFVINDVSAHDDQVHFSCISWWAQDARTVGTGAVGQLAGLICGKHPVYVKTTLNTNEELVPLCNRSFLPKVDSVGGNVYQWSDDPLTHVVSYRQDNGATGRHITLGTDYWIDFACAIASEANSIFYNLLQPAFSNDTLIVQGQNAICRALSIAGDTGSFSIQVTADFYNAELSTALNLIFAYDSSKVKIPIASGAISVTGWKDESGVLLKPSGDFVTQNGSLYFLPKELTKDGYVGYGLIPSKAKYVPEKTKAPTGANGPTGIQYSGSSIETMGDDASILPYSTFDHVTMQTTGNPQGGLIIYGKGDAIYDSNSAKIAIRLSVDNQDKYSFDKYYVDVKARCSGRYTAGTLANGWYFPFQKRFNAVYSTTSVNLETSVDVGDFDPAIHGTFDSIDSACRGYIDWNFGLTASVANAYWVNFQITAARLYGIKTIPYGSGTALVTGGPSPLTPNADIPNGVADQLIYVGVGFTGSYASPLASTPSQNDPTKFGIYFAPDTKIIDACAKICNEWWLSFSDAAFGYVSTWLELIAPPTFALGRVEDCITEPVFEFAPNGDGYSKKAYIAYVDLPYDPANPSKFFGGWDDDGTNVNGLALWQICHKAWKINGIKRSQTFQFDSVHEGAVLAELWLAKLNGVERMGYLAGQPRYITSKFYSDYMAPAGQYTHSNATDLKMAYLNGYSVDPSWYLYVVSSEYDPMTRVNTVEFLLPPVLDYGAYDILEQSLMGAYDMREQTLASTDDLLQQMIEG